MKGVAESLRREWEAGWSCTTVDPCSVWHVRLLQEQLGGAAVSRNDSAGARVERRLLGG